MSREELIEKLNRITRYDLVDTGKWEADRNMVEQQHSGEWLKVEDLATALGLWYGYVRGEGDKLCLTEPIYED